MRIRIHQLKLMRIHADPDTDPDPKPWFQCISYGSVILIYRSGSRKPILIADQDPNPIWTFLWSLKKLCCQKGTPTGSKSLKFIKYCTFFPSVCLNLDKIVRIRIFLIYPDLRIRIQNYGFGSWRPINYGSTEHCLFHN
jgi:hypothetical protein